ncbi:MAG: glycine--tRNA ligase subunit beta [Parvularculaceae bacterium]
MAEMLLELFSEEIPARMQQRAAEDLKARMTQALSEAGLAPENARAFATPRRLTLVMDGLATKQPDRKEERKGPRVGAPQKAVEGFLRAAGLGGLDECETREDKKGAYYVAVTEQKGKPTAELIAGIVPEIIRGFSWPKSMRWGAGELRWVRPLHRILCVFDGKPVEFEIAGLHAGGETSGHRFHAPEAFAVTRFAEYAEKLKAARVLLDTEERKAAILEKAESLCAAEGLELVPDAGLLDEVAGLVEWPAPLLGAFDEKFLELPDEVLATSMRAHQKYFSVHDPNSSRLANRFVAVANLEAEDGGAAMRAGYERVLTARLSDARFLWDQDRKIPLADRLPELDKITFFAGLGSVGDRVKRIAALARELAPHTGADPEMAEQAARLAKCDLVTGMVYEFPELQGVMGRYYALAEGVNPAIANAIRDHYKPAGPADDIPAEPVAMAVALADKLEALSSFYAIDQKPTGSKDPFALRRAALGVIRIICANDLRMNLGDSISNVLQQLPNEEKGERTDYLIRLELLQFILDRLTVDLRESGYRHDYVAAALPLEDAENLDDLLVALARLQALQEFLSTEDGANLAAAYKRAANILKAEEKKEGRAFDGPPDPALYAQAEETALAAALDAHGAAAEAAAGDEKFVDAMTELASLRAPVDAFFDAVTVNAEDPRLRENRLKLLARLRAACDSIADFSKIEG